MSVISSTTLSAVIVGADLHLAAVVVSPLGARRRAGVVLPKFLSLPEDEARRAIESLTDSARPSVLLTIPSAWCGVRPVAVPPAMWGKARAGIIASIDSFLPISPEDAIAGYIARAGESENAGGYLIAARRSVAQPWIDALARATGQASIEVLSPHMAMAGLGLQHEPSAVVLERGPTGALVRHRLAFGRVSELGAPHETDQPASGTAVMLPGDGAPPPANVRVIDPSELALAAALAKTVAPVSFVPLVGRSRSPLRAWARPAALAAACVAMLLGASAIREWRYQRAIEALSAEQEQLAPRVVEVERLRERARRLSGDVAAASKIMSTEWSRLTPVLAQAHGAVPPEGFLYKVRVDSKAVILDGESPRYLDTLRALEETAAFANARQVNPSVSVSERKMDMFSIRADREAAASAAAKTGGGS